MNDQRFKITQALRALAEAERGKDFQRLAIQIAKTKWPELEATREWHDGGEDATTFFVGSDRLTRSLACSLTGTLKKIREDAETIRRCGKKIDVLVFMTADPVANRTVSNWMQEIKSEFQHDLHVIQETELITLLERPENRWLCKDYLGLELETDQTLAQVAAAARGAVARVLNGWKTEYLYDQGKAIELTLIDVTSDNAPKPNKEVQRLSIRHVHDFVIQRCRVTLVGEPGAGKTFTMIQLVDSLLRDFSAPIPVFVALPVWAASGTDFFTFVESQFPVHGWASGSLARLCIDGQIALILNGWNEIPDSSVERIGAELRALALHNPALPLVISTRTTQVCPPISTARVVHVALLSHGQKADIVKRSGLEISAELLVALETNVALATITNTPLFLSAAIAVARSGFPLPTSRHGLLMRFIEHFEGGPEHSAPLKGPPCMSHHRRYLTHIAVRMTEAGGTTFSFDEATEAIGECSKDLRAGGQIQTVPDSSAVLDLLVRHHLLVLSPNPNGAYRFVHQQFQEWFAAESLRRDVAMLTQSQAPGDISAFQRNILNRSHWREPLHFLMEALAGSGENGLLIAARVVEWAAPVDLLLACELVGAAEKPVWSCVREKLEAWLREWYDVKGHAHRHCALAGMLSTKTPDFQDILWPLLESDDANERFETDRACRPFPIVCLGEEWRLRFARWPADRKAEFIREWSRDATQEHILLASDLINSEESPEVKLACFELLLDAGAYDTLVFLGESLQAKDWPSGFVERILACLPVGYLGSFIEKAKLGLPGTESMNARQDVLLKLQEVEDPEWLPLVKHEIERLLGNSGVDFRPTGQVPTALQPQLKPNATPYLSRYLDAVSEKDPGWVADWLTSQLTQGHFWWEPFTSRIGRIPESALGKLADAAFDRTLDVYTTRQRAVAFAGVDSFAAARRMVEEYLGCKEGMDTLRKEPHYDRSDALEAGVEKIPIPRLVDVVLAIAAKTDEGKSVRRLLRFVSRETLSQISGPTKDALRSLVLRLYEQEPEGSADKGWFRAELVEILGRVGKPSDASLIETWIHDDLHRLRNERKDQEASFQRWEAEGRKGQRPVRIVPCTHWNSYRCSLFQIGDVEAADVFLRLLGKAEMLSFGAWGLFVLIDSRSQIVIPSVGQRPDYFEVHKRQEEKAGGNPIDPTARLYADAIFAAIQRFLPDVQQPDFRLSKNEILSAVASLAAFGDSRAIPFLVQFASDKYLHWSVIDAFHNLMLKGTILSGLVLAQLLEPMISENEKPSCGSNNDHWYMVVYALAILLFSDNPKLGIDRIRKLPDYRLRSYSVLDILFILGSCRASGAVDLILELASKPAIDEHYLYEAASVLSKSPNPDADRGLFVILGKLCTGELNSPHALDHVPRVIAQTAGKKKSLWDEIRRRCTNAHSALERSVLLRILGKVENHDAALSLCDLLDDGLPMGFFAENVIEHAVTERVPPGSNSYYVRPRDAIELKRKLINIAFNEVKRRVTALHLLGVVYRIRLERGWPASEPLHPDIDLLRQMNVPWPLL